MAKTDPKDPRTVKVRHPEQGTHMVTPEVARALHGQNKGWTVVGGPASPDVDVDAVVAKATEPLLARIAELEAQVDADPMPENAAERIDWIDQGITSRATQAQAAEADRPEPRKTVLEHIGSVLNPTSKED